MWIPISKRPMAQRLCKANGSWAPLLCVSAVNTLLSVGADRPHHIQFTNVTQRALAHWPLRCQSFYFCSSSPPKICLEPLANQSGENRIYLQSDYFKGQSFQRCMKSKPTVCCDEKRRHAVFHITFSSAPHFSCSGIDFKMRTPVAASLFCWPTKILFSLGFIVHLPCD